MIVLCSGDSFVSKVNVAVVKVLRRLTRRMIFFSLM